MFYIITLILHLMIASYATAKTSYDQAPNYETYTRQDVDQKANMLNMPTYNQGKNGSCVTQAVISVINLLHYHGKDHVSARCSLNLGNYLAEQPLEWFKNSNNDYLNNLYQYNKTIGRDHYPSGWKGSYPYLITTQIAQYGVIPKQWEHICGKEQTGELAPEKNKLFASKPLKPSNWHVICDDGLPHQSCTDKSIDQIKQAMNHNELVVLGILVTKTPMAYRYYENTSNGKPNVWAYTPKVAACLDKEISDCQKDPIKGGHAVVAYAYKENPHHDQEGLFYIHNSWGEYSGDKGNYYITYRYLEKFLISAISFSKNP